VSPIGVPLSLSRLNLTVLKLPHTIGPPRPATPQVAGKLEIAEAAERHGHCL
jgi:hypothetical protein